MLHGWIVKVEGFNRSDVVRKSSCRGSEYDMVLNPTVDSF